MKKSITALLLAVLCLFSAACESQPASTEAPETTVTTEAEIPETTETSAATQPETTMPQVTDVPWMKLPADRTVTAGTYFVYSCETGEFLLSSRETDAKIYPASATKLFTAYVALQFLTPGQTITAGKVLDIVPKNAKLAGIQKKDTFTTEDLIGLMLLSDGDDAAWLLAEAAGRMLYEKSGGTVSAGDAVNRFMKEMNRQAKLLGMENTQLDNPAGIHSQEHYTTCQDLAVLVMAALEDPVIRRQSAAREASFQLGGDTVTWKNANELLNPESACYCQACLGIKTGETEASGNYLVAVFEYLGQTLVVGVLDCADAQERFPDALQLLNKAFGIS